MKRIALPWEDGRVCAHFGHAPAFMMVDVDDDGTIAKETLVTAPPHQPGLLPTWLAEQGANVILAGGMGGHAQNLLAEKGIQAVLGVPSTTAAEAVQAYLSGTLTSGDNSCDHTGCAH